MARVKKTITTVVRKPARVKKSRPPQRRQAPRPSLSIEPATRKLGQSMADPFSSAACIPDGSLGVGCFSLKQEINSATGTTSGTCCGVYASPNLNYFAYNDSSIAAATTPTISGSWSQPASMSTINAIYRSYRMVSMGMRGVFIGNTSTDQGVILVGVLPTSFALSSLNGLSLAAAANLFRSYKILPLRGGFQVYWRPQDIVDMANFLSTGGTAGLVATQDTVPIICAIVYSASSNSGCLQTELIGNYEGQFWEQQFMSGGLEDSSRVAAEPGWYERAMNLANRAEQIAPWVYAGSVGYARNGITGAFSAIAQTMGNGNAYPRVESQSINDRSRRRLLTY